MADQNTKEVVRFYPIADEAMASAFASQDSWLTNPENAKYDESGKAFVKETAYSGLSKNGCPRVTKKAIKTAKGNTMNLIAHLSKTGSVIAQIEYDTGDGKTRISRQKLVAFDAKKDDGTTERRRMFKWTPGVTNLQRPDASSTTASSNG